MTIACAWSRADSGPPAERAVGQRQSPSSSSVYRISRGTFSGKAGLGWSVGRVEDTVRRPGSSPLLLQPQKPCQLMYLLRPFNSFLGGRGRTRRALETVLTLVPCHPLSSQNRDFFFSFIFISWRLITLQYCIVFLSYIDMN